MESLGTCSNLASIREFRPERSHVNAIDVKSYLTKSVTYSSAGLPLDSLSGVSVERNLTKACISQPRKKP